MTTGVPAAIASNRGMPNPSPVDGMARLARATAAAVFALLGVGAYVRGEGAGLAFPDWPLMNGKLVPALGGIHLYGVTTTYNTTNFQLNCFSAVMDSGPLQ